MCSFICLNSSIVRRDGASVCFTLLLNVSDSLVGGSIAHVSEHIPIYVSLVRPRGGLSTLHDDFHEESGFVLLRVFMCFPVVHLAFAGRSVNGSLRKSRGGNVW